MNQPNDAITVIIETLGLDIEVAQPLRNHVPHLATALGLEPEIVLTAITSLLVGEFEPVNHHLGFHLSARAVDSRCKELGLAEPTEADRVQARIALFDDEVMRLLSGW